MAGFYIDRKLVNIIPGFVLVNCNILEVHFKALYYVRGDLKKITNKITNIEKPLKTSVIFCSPLRKAN